MFWEKRPKVVIEIGTDQLKLYRLTGGKQPSQLIKILRLANLKGPLDKEIPDLLASLGIRWQPVSVILSRQLVNLRFIEIPSVDPEEVNNIVQLQGVKQTPYSRDEVILSHCLLRGREDGYSEIALAFCQRKFVNERIGFLKMAGLQIESIGISSEGVIEWYLQNHPAEADTPSQGLIILVNCDSSFSDVIFCRDRRFLFSRTIALGQFQVMEGPEQKLEEFCREVQHVLELTTEEMRLEEPKKIILIASVPNAPQLRTKIEKQLGVSVEFLDPSMSLTEGADLQIEGGGSLTSLIGFAGKQKPRFDLTPEDIRLHRSIEKKSREIIMTGAFALGLLAAVSLFFAGHFYQKRKYLELLEKELQKTQEIASSIEEKLMRTNLMEKIKTEDSSFLFYLAKITGFLSDGMYFQSIEYAQGDKITLKGNAGKMSDVFDFAKKLEESKIFKGVKSEHVSKTKSGNESLANFDIICLM